MEVWTTNPLVDAITAVTPAITGLVTLFNTFVSTNTAIGTMVFVSLIVGGPLATVGGFMLGLAKRGKR